MDTTKVSKDLETPKSDEIKTDIDRTRARMDQTISELGERLHPKNLISDLVEYVRSRPSTNGHNLAEDAQKAAKAVLHQARLHPIPSVLFTAGVVWLLVEKQKKSALRRPPVETMDYAPGECPPTEWATDYYEPAETEAKGAVITEQPHQAKRKIMETIKETKEKAGEKFAAVGSGIKSAVNTVTEKVGSAAHATVESGRHLKVRTGQVLGKAKTQIQHGYDIGRERYSYGRENYPLMMGAGCLALGVLVGYLLPHTRREDELIGPASARLMDKTKAAGQKILDQTKQVAGEAVDRAVGEAKSQGLTPGHLAEKVGQVAATAGQNVREKVYREGTDMDRKTDSHFMGAQSVSQPNPVPKEPVTAGPGCGCGSV